MHPRTPTAAIGALATATLALATFAAPAPAAGPDPIDRGGEMDDHIESIKRARNGAGIRIGSWNVQDLPDEEGVRYSRSPNYEGYFLKGLDTHLAVESTISLWKWVQEIEEEGSLGSSSREVVTTYIVPAFTAIKLHPFTDAENRIEPYVDAGIGFAFGIEDAEVQSQDGLFGFATGDGTSFQTGFGIKGGLGADWRFSRPFGLTAGGSYRWLRFSEEVGGKRTFKGFGLNLGMTYRFQY